MKNNLQNVRMDKNNEYYTPRYVVELIIPFLKEGSIIWCPADEKQSEFVITLRENGFKVINTHINTGEDFLTYQPDFEFDYIITNPPFSLKIEFLQKCIDYNKPFALLLGLQILSYKTTMTFMHQNDMDLMFPVGSRISFNGSAAPFQSGYFTKGIQKQKIEYVLIKDGSK